MEKWSNIPSEILNVIFSHLNNEANKRDLWECASTCYRWKITAHTYCFEKVTLESIEYINHFMELVSKTYNPGIFVKTLKINKTCTLEAHHVFAYMFSLTTLFPNLEYLDFETEDDWFYYAFYRIFCMDKFPCLREVPPSKSFYQDQLYLECTEQLQSRICKLFLIRSLHNRNTYTPLYEKLKQYVGLKSVDVEINNEEVESVMNYVESLTKLTPLQEINMRLFSSSPAMLAEEPDILKPAVSLTRLNVTCHVGLLCFGDDKSMLYMINKLPNLQRLQINNIHVPRIGHHTLYTTPTMSVVAEFLQYLSSIPSCSLHTPIITDHHTASIINQFYLNLKRKKRLYQPETIQNSLNVFYNKTQFLLENAVNRTAVVEYSQDLNKKKIRDVVIVFKKNLDNYNQLLQILEQSGPCIDQFCVDSVPTHGDGSLIDHVIKHCVHLSKLTLRHFFDTGLEVIQCHSLQDLVLENLELSQHLFNCISDRFVHLKNLVIEEDCYFEWGFQFLDMNLSQMSLNCLHIKTRHIYPDVSNRGIDWKGIYIKLTTTADNRIHYCLLQATKEIFTKNVYTFESLSDCTSTAAEFQSRMNDDSYWIYVITCASVQEMIVEYDFIGGVRNYVRLE